MTVDETAVLLGVAAVAPPPPPPSSIKNLPTKEMKGVDPFYMHDFMCTDWCRLLCYIESSDLLALIGWESYVSDG